MNFVCKSARESPSLNNIRKVKISVIEAFLSFLISSEFYRTHMYQFTELLREGKKSDLLTLQA